MAAFPEDEEDVLGSARPVNPVDLAQGMSTDVAPASVQTAGAEFPTVPTVATAPKQEFAPVPADYDRQQAADAREADRLARESARTAEAQARATAAAETKRLRASGVRMTVDGQNNTVPETRDDGSMVYEPGWAGAPRYDEASKAWVRDQRDDTGKIAPVDLWNNGDISREPDTGELYITMPGGVRNVVGKDADYLRRRAIGQEINTITRQTEETDIALDRDMLELKPLEAQYKERQKDFENVSTRLKNLQSMGLKNPGWLKANGDTLRVANEDFERVKKEYLPMQARFAEVEKRKQELTATKLKGRERRLALYAERDALEAAGRRPEFAAPAGGESGSEGGASGTIDGTRGAASLPSDRERYGIGGDAYVVPTVESEVEGFRSRMKALDEEARVATGPAMTLGPDLERDAKLAEINKRRSDEIKTHAGRQAALERYHAEESALGAAATRAEAEAQAKKAERARTMARLDNALASNRMSPEQYAAETAKLETLGGDDAARKAAFQSRRSELKRSTFRALHTHKGHPSDGGGAAEFPENLIDRTSGVADLDPRAVELRATGRAAAFGTGSAQEYYETLLEIQKAGTIAKVGGVPIKDAIREAGAQSGLRIGDVLAPEEADAIRAGFDGTLASHRSALLGETPVLDGERTLAKPTTDREAERLYWSDRLSKAMAEDTAQRAEAVKSEAARVPGYQKEILAKRDEIRNRKPEEPEGFAFLTPAAKKKFLETFNRQKEADLAALYEKNTAMGGDRADFVKSLQGEKAQEFDAALEEELTGRLRAAVWSPTAGVWDVGAGLVDTLAHVEALGRGIAPEETGLHAFAKAAREGTADLQGEKRDTLVSQVGRGVGSSLAFLPAAMAGGGPAVAAFGAAQAFGSGYFDAKEKAAAKGKAMPEVQAYLNGLLGAGLGSTEGLPIARALDRLDKFTGGVWRRLLNIGKEGGEEFLQEAGQNLVQAFADKVQGLDDRGWKEILGESLSSGTVAALSGLILGVSMNAVDEKARARQTTKLEEAFGAADRAYMDLSAAVRSPEALAKFNQDLLSKNPEAKPVSAAAANDMLSKVEAARNDAALRVMMNDEALVEATIREVSPGEDVAKFSAEMAGRPAVLSQAVALGRDLGPTLNAERSTFNVEVGNSGGDTTLLKNAVAGFMVIRKLKETLHGGSMPAALGQGLEAQGLLVQKATPSGGTKWVLTGPALALMDGETRRRVAKAPEKFAYAAEADTGAAGELNSELKREGDARVSRGVGTAPAASERAEGRGKSDGGEARSTAPGGAAALPSDGAGATYTVTLEGEPDASGFKTTRQVSVQAASPEEAPAAAIEQAKKWKGEWTPRRVVQTSNAERPTLNAQVASEGGSAGAEVSGEKLPDQGAAAPYAPGDGQSAAGTEPAARDALREGGGGAAAGDGGVVQAKPGGEGVPGTGGDGGTGGGTSAGNVPDAPTTAEPGGSGILGGNPGVSGESPEAAEARVKEAWEGRGYDVPLLKKALSRAGVKVSQTKAKSSMVDVTPDGGIVVNLNPDDLAREPFDANATVNEEVWHVGGTVAKRKAWVEAGKPGTFEKYVEEDLQRVFDDLIGRLETLETGERAQVEEAMVASFNSYFAPYTQSGRLVRNEMELRALLASGVKPKNAAVPPSVAGFVHEFARQLAQMREANSITEETHREFLEGLIQWIRDAVNALRALAAGLDAEGGVLDGTLLQKLVLEMEAEIRWLAGEINSAGLAEMKKDIDKAAAAPVMSWLSEQGGVIGKGKAVNPGGEYDDAIPMTVLGGHASKVYGNALRPDEAAQGLFDAGLIAEPSPTAMWEAIAQEVKTLKGLLARPRSGAGQMGFSFALEHTGAEQVGLRFDAPAAVVEEPVAPEPAEREPIANVESLLEFFRKLRDGEVTAEEVRQAWEDFKANWDTLEAEVSGMTMKQLSRWQGWRKPSNKPEAVRRAMDLFSTMFNPGDSLSYDVMGGGYRESMRRALDAAVKGWTDERIQAAAKERREAKAAQEKALTNPETLSDFDDFIWEAGKKALSAEERVVAKKLPADRVRGLIRARGIQQLTDEQLAKYDDLRATEDLREREQRKQIATPTRVEQVANLDGVDMELIETEHTRDKYPLFVVRMSERVERETYADLNAKAKMLGGWYSSFRGNGAIPGFQFKSREAAEQFMSLKEGDVDRGDLLAVARREREEETTGNAVERLRAMADRMEASAEESLGQHRRQNTARQAGMAEYAEARARSEIEQARTMRNLAEAIESGAAKYLSTLRTRTQLETLQSLLRSAKSNHARALEKEDGSFTKRARDIYDRAPIPADVRHAAYPQPRIHSAHLNDLVAQGLETPGLKRASAKLAKITPENRDSSVTIPDFLLDELKLVSRGLLAGRLKWTAENALGAVADYDRLHNMGIRSTAHLRAALREYFGYKGAKVEADPMKALERELIGKDLPGFFPTPPSVVRRVMEIAQIEPAMSVLEPSAGKGDMAKAARAEGGKVDVAEMQSVLSEILKAQGFEPIGRDFLTMPSEEKYDRVVMNPPFEERADATHVRHAYTMLKPGGRLVAVMSAGTLQASSGAAKGFQDWLEAHGGIVEDVEAGAFNAEDSFRKTGVNTKIVTLDKPGSLRARPRTIETVGEDRLLTEAEMPFNLVGEVDDSQARQRVIDERRAAEEARRAAEGAQMTLFARPRTTPQKWFDFGVDGSQRTKEQLPLLLSDATRDLPDASRVLFNANVGLAHKIANEFRNVGEWEDVRQEALISLSRAAMTYRPQRGNFANWAGAIIRNHLRDLYARAQVMKRIPASQTDSLDEEVADDGMTRSEVIAGDAASPAREVARSDAIEVLRAVIAGLAPDLRDIVERRMAGQTQEEVAKSRGITKQSISGAEKVALAAIKAKLRARGIDSFPLGARPRSDQATFDRELNDMIFPKVSEDPTPAGATGQETFTAGLDREIFPRMADRDLSREPERRISPEEVESVSEAVQRDARDIAEAMANRPEEEEHDMHRTTVRDLYNRFLRGRFDKLNYFAPGSGDVLLDAQRDNADFAAAMRLFNETLEKRVKAAFGNPSWWRKPETAARLKKFKDLLLPYAAALNPVARDGAGDLVWESFWQRHGELSGAQLERMGRMPHEEWVEPTTGERWRVNGFVAIEGRASRRRSGSLTDGNEAEGFYQLERWIPAEAQEKVHESFHDMFPEGAQFLDDFIEPGMEAERVTSSQGVELPSFNRHSLYGFYGDTPAGLVEKLPGYTPDVTRTRSIAGMAAKVLKLDWQSPGRDYKSGQARVTGQVRNLFEGFNIRAAQAHMETVRRENAEQLLKATLRPVPESGVPDGYKRLDRDTLNPLIRAMRSAAKKGQEEMPEILENATDRLTQKNLETLKFLFGDPELFNENQMVHEEVIAELSRGFVRRKVDNAIMDGVMSWTRGNVAGVLADFQTIAINKLSNYVFHAMRAAQRTAYAGLAAASGEPMEAKRAIREAGYLVRGFFTNYYHPAIRERVNRLVPPEIFEDQNVLRQLMADSADLSVADLLKQANVGGAFLKAVGYGNMDVRAKQKLALASLLSRASIAADEAGIEGTARRAWMEKWIEQAPVEARREAEMAAKLYLMDYANVPAWLDQGVKAEFAGHDVTPWVNFVRALAIPFWKYPYNYLRQMKRLSVDSAAKLTWKQKLATKQERLEAAANLTSMAMLMTAYWLLTHPWGDDDEEILGREVDDAGEEIDPKLRTSSRVRLADTSILGGAVGTAARMFGADTENDDLWVRLRTMPYATQAMALGAALKWAGNPASASAKTAVDSAWDMAEDFMSIGSGARLGAAFLGLRDDYTRYQNASFILGGGIADLVTARVLPPRALKDIANLIDPINRRYTPSEGLDYNPGAIEAVLAKIPGLTKILPPSGKVQTGADPNSEKTQAARAELEALGLADTAYREYVDEKTGKLRAAYVRPEFIYTIPGWKALVRQGGFNVKPVPKGEYRDALAGGE